MNLTKRKHDFKKSWFSFEMDNQDMSFQFLVGYKSDFGTSGEKSELFLPYTSLLKDRKDLLFIYSLK